MNSVVCAVIGGILTILVVAGTQAILPDVQGAVIGGAGVGGALAAFVGYYFTRGARPLP